MLARLVNASLVRRTNHVVCRRLQPGGKADSGPGYRDFDGRRILPIDRAYASLGKILFSLTLTEPMRHHS